MAWPVREAICSSFVQASEARKSHRHANLGGLVGISGNPDMIDGSSVSAPTFAFYELDGTWGIEGHGVDPDIKVVDDPTLLSKGIDPQMDVAIQTMLSEIETHGFSKPPRPAYPDRKPSAFARKTSDLEGSFFVFTHLSATLRR